MKNFRAENFLLAGLFVFLFLLDQATKALAYAGSFGSFLNYLRPVLGKLIFPNYNFAFSLPVPHLLMYLIYIFLLALLVWIYLKSDRSMAVKALLVLIFCGALSNIYDRFIFGYVRDFIFIFWGNIFNFADLYIVAGLLGLLLYPGSLKKEN